MRSIFLLLLGVLGVAACSTKTAATDPDSTAAVCSSDAECPDSVCDPVTDKCVACTKDEHCSGTRPYCAENTCNTCVIDAHCLVNAQASAASQPRLYVFPTSCTTDHRCIPPTRRCDDVGDCGAFLCPSPYLPLCSNGTCACQRS